MKRKDFLRVGSLAGSGLLMSLNGINLHAMTENKFLQNIAKSSTNDRVVVLVQLHGGNDGLNMVIPLDQYSLYYNLRPNIAIPQSGNRKYITLDTSLPANKQVGLHPDMVAAKSMYDNGQMAIVQNVSYENMNGSHFRSRDVWYMGGDYDDYMSSGWMGRYLEHYYPGYPDGYPSPQNPDPLAMEIGTGVSLAFHRNEGIPMGLSVENPNAFYNLINSVGGEPPISIPDTHAGDEIEYIMQIERQSNNYAGRLRDVYNAGSNSATVYPSMYPFVAPSSAANNHLAPQLKIVSRLLSGGSGTKIFLCRIGGFDTHANQVVGNNTSMGGHAALLYHISTAMKAFYEDLTNLGIADRVLAMTFSEFGRRPASNASFGTDHGNAAPMLIFGTCLNPGVYGTNPRLDSLVGGNIPLQHDYRQVYSSIVKDWFGASDHAINDVMFGDFIENRVDYINCKATAPLSTSSLFKENLWMKCYPNPTSRSTTVTYYLRDAGHVELEVKDLMGKSIGLMQKGKLPAGEYTTAFDFTNQHNGMYLITLTIDGSAIITEKIIVNK